MEWPYKFPDPGDETAREAARFRSLPPEEQARIVIEMTELADRLIQASPNRDAILRRIAADEEAWREAHRRIFALHGH